MTTPTDTPDSAPATQCENKYRCKNMRPKEGDLSLEYEHYECKVCGEVYKLDYDEMR